MSCSPRLRWLTATGLVLGLLAWGIVQPVYGQWAFNLGKTSNVEATHIASDAAGNIYVTGLSESVVDLDPDSTRQALHPGLGFLASYTPSGRYRWSTATDAWAHDLKAGPDGGIYVAGWERADEPSGQRSLLARYTLDGHLDWRRSIADTRRCTGVTRVAPDQLVVACDGLIFERVRHDGTTVWRLQLDRSTPDNNDVIAAVAADSSGNVYALGTFHGRVDFDPALANAAEAQSAGSTDVFLASYDSTGAYRWHRTVGDENEDGTFGHGLGVDALGNLYTSFTATLDDAGRGHFLTKYSPTLDVEWRHELPGTTLDMAVDAEGGVQLVGVFSGTQDFDLGPNDAPRSSTNESGDIFVARYDSNARYDWAFHLGGGLTDLGTGITLLPNESVAIVGLYVGRADVDPSPNTFTLNPVNRSDVWNAFVALYGYGGVFNVADEPHTIPAPSVSMSLFPNPAQGAVRLDVQLPHAGVAQVAVYDALGRQVTILHDGYLLPHTAHAFEVDTSTWRPGVYWIRIRGELLHHTQALVVQ